MTIEAVRPDGTSATVYSTATASATRSAARSRRRLDMTGFAKLRFSCDFFNPRAEVVGWGVGDQEMCVFLAFSDSQFVWAGGAINIDGAGSGSDTGTEIDYTHTCSLITAAAN